MPSCPSCRRCQASLAHRVPRCLAWPWTTVTSVAVVVFVLFCAFSTASGAPTPSHALSDDQLHMPSICAWVHSHEPQLRMQFRSVAKPFLKHLVFVLDEYDQRFPNETDIVEAKGKVTHLHLYFKARRGLEALREVADDCDWFLKLDEDAVINWPMLVDVFKLLQPVSMPIYGGYIYYFTTNAVKPADTYFSAEPLPFAPYANGPLYYMSKSLFDLLTPFRPEDIYWTGHAEDACIGVFLRDSITEPVLFHDLQGSIFGKYMHPEVPPAHLCWWMMLHEIPSNATLQPPCRMPRNHLPSLGVWVLSRHKQQARRLTTQEMNSVFGHMVPLSNFEKRPQHVEQLVSKFEQAAQVSLEQVSVESTALPESVKLYLPKGPHFDPPLSERPAGVDVETFAVELFSFKNTHAADAIDGLQDDDDIGSTAEPPEDVAGAVFGGLASAQRNFVDSILHEDAVRRSLDDSRSGQPPAHQMAKVYPPNIGRQDLGSSGISHTLTEATHRNKLWQKLRSLFGLGSYKPWDQKFRLFGYKFSAWSTLLSILSKTRGTLVAVGTNIFDDLVGLSLFNLASSVVYLPCDGTAFAHAEVRQRRLGLKNLIVDPRCVRSSDELVGTEVVLRQPSVYARVGLQGQPLGDILSDYGIHSSSQTIILASTADRHALSALLEWTRSQETKPWIVAFGRYSPANRGYMNHMHSMYMYGYEYRLQNAVFYGPVMFKTASGPEHLIS